MDIDQCGYVYSWKFKVDTLDNKNYKMKNKMIIIGITDSTQHDHADFSMNFGNEGYSSYAYISNGYKASDVDKEYGEKFNVNDIVTMMADIGKKQIRFSVNGKHQGIAFDNIDFGSAKYKMAVYTSDTNIKIKLIEFQIDLDRSS